MNYRFFVDDGWSGANFERPSFKEMIEGVENGEIKTIITKELSRLGRNYLQVGMYTEMVFPRKGVRYIAINDGVDSEQGDNDLTPLKNLFNEWLVRDTSKKIRAVKRSKGISGKPVTSKPVYGYLMNEDERSPVYEAPNRAERGRGQTPERRQEERAGSGRKTDCGTLRYLQAAV